MGDAWLVGIFMSTVVRMAVIMSSIMEMSMFVDFEEAGRRWGWFMILSFVAIVVVYSVPLCWS
jgi:hypothetical protein